MPYVPLDQRQGAPVTPGQLNFVISKAVKDYLARRQGQVGYERLNEVIGVLECAKLELYRRVAAPYEDHMRDVNGDVY